MSAGESQVNRKVKNVKMNVGPEIECLLGGRACLSREMIEDRFVENCFCECECWLCQAACQFGVIDCQFKILR